MASLTDWEWWAGEIDCETYAVANEPTREKVIQASLRYYKNGEQFQIIEARQWERGTDHPDPDHVPFARTRNHEIVTAGVRR